MGSSQVLELREVRAVGLGRLGEARRTLLSLLGILCSSVLGWGQGLGVRG